MPDAPAPAGAGAPPDPERAKLRRLLKRAEFLHVAAGISAARGAVVVQAREPGGSTPAALAARHAWVGFTATKKIGDAVTRNRAKRRLREAARALLPLHGQAGRAYVFVARAGTPSRPWERLLDDVRQALQALEAGGDARRPPPRNKRPRSPGPKPTHG